MIMCHYPMTEPVRGTPEVYTDGDRGWTFAPSGHRYPFDKIIRIVLVRHIEGENKLVAQWAKKGEYTLRYNDDLAEEISQWEAGKRYRVKMWMDRIDEILPLR